MKDFTLSLDVEDSSGDMDTASQSIYECPNCSWWVFKSNSVLSFKRPRCKYTLVRSMVQYGKMKVYDLASVSKPLGALKRWLSKMPERTIQLEPLLFEKIVADCFKDYYSDVELIHLGGTKDGVIDIMVVKNDGVETLVQLNRSNELKYAESVSTIRELNGGFSRNGKCSATVMTNRRRFSPDVNREAKSSDKSLARYKIELRAFDDISEILGCTHRRAKSELYESISENRLKGK